MTAERGGGTLARPETKLGIAQRRGILQTKAQQPTATHAEIAALYGVSAKSVERMLAMATVDMQPVIRTYADDLGEAAVDAALFAAKEGKGQQAVELMIASGALPDRQKAGTGLNVTVIVSAPPGTPQYQPHQAPPVLVLEASAGPQFALTPLETKAEP